MKVLMQSREAEAAIEKEGTRLDLPGPDFLNILLQPVPTLLLVCSCFCFPALHQDLHRHQYTNTSTVTLIPALVRFCFA